MQVVTDKPDMICLTETFLPQDVSDSLVSLPGYSPLRYDRPEPHPGGGVALFIKDYSSLSMHCPHTPRNTSGYGFPSTPTSCLYVCCSVHQTVMTPFTPHYLKTWTNFYLFIQTFSSSYVLTSIVIMPVGCVWVPLSPVMALQQKLSVTHWD